MNADTADSGLMRRIAARDEAAFAGLVEGYGARLYTVALRLLGSPADAEDAVQRAFLRCFTSARDYRPEWAVSTWLYRILTNLCIDELRRRAARGRHEESGNPEEVGNGKGVRSGTDAAADRLDVGRAMQRVPREARILMTLRYVDGLDYAELARIRGISINTVKSQLARAKSILRAALGDREPRGQAPRGRVSRATRRAGPDRRAPMEKR